MYSVGIRLERRLALRPEDQHLFADLLALLDVPESTLVEAAE